LLASRESVQDLVRRGEIVEVIGTVPVDWLGIPLKVGDEALGVLAVQSYRQDIRFGEREKEVLTFVSQHIGSALNRRRAEDALIQSESKYRSILENIEDAYYEVDLGGSITFFNNSVSEIIGYPAQELMGLNHRSYMDDGTAKEVYQTFNRVFRTGEPTKD